MLSGILCFLLSTQLQNVQFHAQDHHTVGSVYPQQSDTHPSTSENHLKMDPEHPKTDTSHFIHTACPAAAEERLTALQTTSTAQELEFGHSQAKFWCTATARLKISNQGKAVRGFVSLLPSLLSLLPCKLYQKEASSCLGFHNKNEIYKKVLQFIFLGTLNSYWTPAGALRLLLINH